MKATGAQILIECLCEQGVDTCFGYPGGAIISVYDALYDNKDRIRHILTAHEQGAVHAADGYARATGKTGVCLATSGPGATNLVTGIATAYMDSVPLVAITCNVATNLLGKDSFQEIDITGITMPITKHNYIVNDVEKLADTVREAFTIANSGRKGPVLIDIPKDVTLAEYEYEPAEEPVPYCKKIPHVTEREVKKTVEIIDSSEKIVMIAGGGVISSGASEEFTELAERLQAPVAVTLMGTGTYPCDGDLYVGMLGMHGTEAANRAVTQADLIIAVGVRFSDRVIGGKKNFGKDVKVIHIDIDSAEIDKNIRHCYGMKGDAKEVLTALLEKVEPVERNSFTDYILSLNDLFPHMNGDGLTPERIIKTVDRLTEPDAVIATEVGQHQMWTQQFYCFRYPRTFITSGGLGTMGFGTGAAIGASVGTGRTVINIAGDGSFRMNLIELATISEYRIPVIVVVVNNSVLGMVRQWQTLFFHKRYSETNLGNRGPDFKKVAEAYGIKGYRAETPEEFESCLKKALESGEAAVIDAVIDSDTMVLPMKM